jgi:hypothetical protein
MNRRYKSSSIYDLCQQLTPKQAGHAAQECAAQAERYSQGVAEAAPHSRRARGYAVMAATTRWPSEARGCAANAALETVECGFYSGKEDAERIVLAILAQSGY